MSDIFFAETGYSIYTLRQASRRSWRIGQRSNVNVKFFYDAGTMQEACLRLMGRKLLVALAMEGKFSTEGLQAVGEDDDLLMAMARELVTEKGIGENAELVWRSIQQQNEAFAHAAPAPVDAEHEAPPEDTVISHQPLPAIVDQLQLFGPSLRATEARKHGTRRSALAILPADTQLGLF